MLPAVLYGSPLPTISHKTHDLLQISQTATPGCRIAAQAGLAWAPLFSSYRHSPAPAHIVRSRIPPPLFVPLNTHGRIFSLCLKCQEILQPYPCRLSYENIRWWPSPPFETIFILFVRITSVHIKEIVCLTSQNSRKMRQKDDVGIAGILLPFTYRLCGNSKQPAEFL